MIRACLLFSLILLNASPAFAQQHAQAIADAKKLNSQYHKYSTNEYRQLFQPGYFGVDFDDQVKGYREHLAKLAAFEQNDLPGLKKLVGQFQSRYGSDRAAIRKTFQQINNSHGGVSGDPAYSWGQLQEVVGAAGKTRTKLAQELVKLGSKGGQTHQGYNIMTVEESYAQAKAFLELAVAYQADHAEAKRKLASIDGEQKEQLAASEKNIDAAVFGPHSEHFQGPGSTVKIAAAATDYLSKKESGKDGKLLALRIAGDWRVADRNILGDTVTWGLPVEVAYRQQDDPETAKVVTVELITRGKSQEPPFQRHRFFGARYVRVGNLPGQHATAGSFAVLRLPLAGLLIMLGLVAAAPLVEQRIPATKTVLDQVRPYAPVIGVAALALGGAALLFSIFSPLGDVLPQLAAVVVGLLMGWDILIKRTSMFSPDRSAETRVPANTALQQKARTAARVATETARQAVTKAQDLLIDQQASIRRLDTFRVPLGVGCLVLGLLHLVAGGFILF